MRFIAGSPEKRVHCYRVLDDNGHATMSTILEQVYMYMCVYSHSYRLSFITYNACDLFAWKGIGFWIPWTCFKQKSTMWKQGAQIFSTLGEI